jgi:hypothetical protein
MGRFWLRGLGKSLACACVGLLAAAGLSRADEAELKAQLEAQQKQIQELKAMIQASKDAATKDPPKKEEAKKDEDKKDPAKKEDPKLDEATVKKLVGDYLRDNPGAGMPSGVQTGWESPKGFVIRSAPNPSYTNWKDDSRIPFELNIHGRIQADYYMYKVTDTTNHLTGVGGVSNTSPDFDQLEIKRGRFWFEGNAFDPNLRYHLQFDGNTRGIGAAAGGGVPGTNGSTSVGGQLAGGASLPAGVTALGVQGGNTIGTVDHAARLFSAYVAYDFHPCNSYKGCGCDCPEGTYLYSPTFTLIFGKLKPMIAFEEYLGSGNEQFVEFNMGNWFFDADDDNLLMGAGTQIRAFDDRFYLQALITNGNESQFANLQMDDIPGFNIGFWYDFGGDWDTARNRWILFGPSLSDLEWHCHPVLRVGAAANIVPMDRRSEFTNLELSRLRPIGDAPGGSTLLGILNGANLANNAAGLSPFAMDVADSYTYDAFVCGKWRGFSFYNEWWAQNWNNIKGRRAPSGAYPGNGKDNPILYTSNVGGTSFTSLFPAGKGLFNFGTAVQAGYFVIPKKLELAARWSYVAGDSGNINGDNSAPIRVNAPAGVPAGTTVFVRRGAFDHFTQAQEFAVGFNYFFYGQNVKWSTDLSNYTGPGGNPDPGAQSPAGFIPGVNGWLLRSQIQLQF